MGIQVHFKEDNTIRNLLVAQRTRKYHTKSGVIYRYKCGRLGCDEEYIGESARTFEESLMENLWAILLSKTMSIPQVITPV